MMQFIFWVFDKSLNRKTAILSNFETENIDQQLLRKNVPGTNVTDTTAVVFPRQKCHKLGKCLKFKSVGGGGGGACNENDCTLFKITLDYNK